MTDRDFETRLARELRRYADGGVTPIDALALAEATMSRAPLAVWWRSRTMPRSMVALAAALLTLAVIGAAVIIGLEFLRRPLVPPDFLVDPSPLILPSSGPSIPRPSPIAPETAIPTAPGLVDRDPGQLAYAGDGDIFLAAWDGSSPRRIADGDDYRSPQWSPDGRYLNYAGPGGRWGAIVVADATGRTVATLDGTLALWSPGSTQLALFRLSRDAPDGVEPTAEIVIVEIDGVEIGRLPLPDRTWFGTDPTLAWWPDGSAIVMSGMIWGTDGDASPTHLMPLDGGGPRDLAFRYAGFVQPFSPDATRALVVDGTSLAVADLDGSDPVQVRLPGSIEAFQPQWSGDGRRLAVTAFDEVGSHLFVVEVESGVATLLFTIPPVGLDQLVISAVSWSPRADLVLAASDSLLVVGADGSNPRTIVTGTRDGSWQPVGLEP